MTELASVVVGNCGSPGSSASKICCTITEIREGRYEAYGYCSTGCNQAFYQANYGYGPWRGRGENIREALDEMLDVVPAEYHEDMKRAAKEAEYEAEDAMKAID